MTDVGEPLNPGLLLKSMCVFKLCLECFHRGFLFYCLMRTPLGNVESYVESVDSCWGFEFLFVKGKNSAGDDLSVANSLGMTF